MIETIVNKTIEVHKAVFMEFRKKGLGGAHSQVVLPTYERKGKALKDETEIIQAAYFDLVRRRTNELLSSKTRNVTYAFAVTSAFVGALIVMLLWSTHQPFSQPLKEKIVNNERVNAVFSKLPDSMQEKIRSKVNERRSKAEHREQQNRNEREAAAAKREKQANEWANNL